MFAVRIKSRTAKFHTIVIRYEVNTLELVIDESNVVFLINNQEVFIETTPALGKEVPIGAFDHNILKYAEKTYSARKAELKDLNLILSFVGKIVHVTKIPALKLESTFVTEEVFA